VYVRRMPKLAQSLLQGPLLAASLLLFTFTPGCDAGGPSGRPAPTASSAPALVPFSGTVGGTRFTIRLPPGLPKPSEGQTLVDWQGPGMLPSVNVVKETHLPRTAAEGQGRRSLSPEPACYSG
jgi:hypothetical protein